jgi:transposase
VGAQLKPLGEDVSEQLDIIDAAFKVIGTIRRKKACGSCDCIVQPPAPSRPIERGVAAPGLLRILVAKYADPQPLYRQSAIYARQDVELNRSSMARRVGACGALVAPLVDALCRYVLAGSKVHADDTPVSALARAMARPKPHDCGPMCAVTATLDRWIRQPSGLPTHPIGRGFTHGHILRACLACCEPTPTPASMRCSRMAT